MGFEKISNVSLTDLFVQQIENMILSGELKVGEKLPSVRDLAFEYKVNPNTVQKALQELESIGLIYTERTNGKFVTNDQKLIDKSKEKFAYDISISYLKSMNELGYNQKDALNYLKSLRGDK